MNKKILIIPIAFFLICLLTLKDYGINWDEPWHYMRGQAFFQYLTTGKTDYKNVTGRRSYYQNDSLNGAYFLQNDSAHPPANDILASLFNYIFYRKLNLLGDLESYHLFIIFISTLGVLAVSLFAYEVLGLLAGVVAGLVFATYPLFFAESHFNIKDPVETAFYTLTLWAFWKSIKNGSWKWLILSLVSCGLALGTKFNIVFIPLIILPYLVMRYWGHFPKISKTYKICLVFSPLVILGVFLFFWPFLWHSPIKNFINAVKYYQDIGTGINYQTLKFMFMKFNLYAIFWIIVTTPPLVMFLSVFGAISLLFRKASRDKTEYLWLFWLVVPIARVTLPNTSIYGGVRQIMEYIPAMALMACLGAINLVQILETGIKKFRFLDFSLCLFILAVLVFPLVKYHPNENVYFNFLIGGLSGAKEKNIPSWGNSFGNAYWQAIQWLNLDAEENSKLALVQGTGSNLAGLKLREDIKYSNTYWSGIRRKGEYLLELTGEQSINPYPYVWEYVNKMLEPVHEVKVDGIAIAKVWKNDLLHTNEKFRKQETGIFSYKFTKKGKEMDIIFDSPVVLTRFFLTYRPDPKCQGDYARIRVSIDGNKWVEEKDAIPIKEQVSVPNILPNTSAFFFAARDSRYLKIITQGEGSCLLQTPHFEIWGLK